MIETQNLSERYKVDFVGYDDCREWILKKHYAHRMTSVSFSFGLFDYLKLIGVVTFGMPANYILNDQFKPFNLLELNRLVLNDNHERNLTSWFLSKCFGLLPKPLTLISYSDIGKHHFGYIYQATNWIYTGIGGAIPKQYYLKMGRKNIKDI